MASTDATDKTPFVFIDGDGNPFRVAWTGIECRMYSWNEPEGRWIDLRNITDDYAREFRLRAVPADFAKRYDDRHAKAARKK